MNSILINGEWLDGLGEKLKSINPMDQSVVWFKKSASTEQVNAAVQNAAQAQIKWQALPLNARIQIITKFAQGLAAQQTELAHIISLETGKPDWEALTEVTAMINKIDISIKAQLKRANPLDAYDGDKPNLHLSHRPHGVMAVFGPYNFPGHLANGHIVPALLAGNSIVFKPSEQTPYTAEKTLQIWLDAGLPNGVINLVQGGKEVGQTLSQAKIDGLLFTGSSNTGGILHKAFGGRPEILLSLEMGGNNALIIDQGVDSQTALNIILQSAFLSTGQRCTCARRLIIVNDSNTNTNTDAFIEKLVTAMKSLIADSPSAKPEPFMGPVINLETLKALFKTERSLMEIGGKSLLPMKHLKENSCLLSPGLMDMSQAKNIPDDEIFGPLLQLYVVNDFASAMAKANETKFGLAAGLVSDNKKHQEIFKHTIKAGVISINQPTAGASSELPFGGIGCSGNHRPSALYAADYCAWPQALSQGGATTEKTIKMVRGLKT